MPDTAGLLQFIYDDITGFVPVYLDIADEERFGPLE